MLMRFKMIRSAVKSDALSICNLVKSVTVTRDDTRTGFIEYPAKSEQWYQQSIEDGDFYIHEECGEVVAFLSTYENEMLSGFKEDQVVQEIIKTVNPKFTYFDQLAVTNEFRGKGLARNLLNHTLSGINETVVCAISHAPKKNDATIYLFKGLDFDMIGEFTVYDGLTFGLYALKR